MRPQITFFIMVVLIVLVIINYPKINYLVYGTTEYNVTYETYYRPFNTTTDDIVVIVKKIETTTKFSPIFNSTNVTKSTSETYWNKHIDINFPESSSVDYNLKSVIETALVSTDIKTVVNITSINVVSQYKVASVCKDIKASGCFDQSLSKIYISNLDAYSNTCNTFGNTLYHEIGHADRLSKFGEAPNIQIDEDYADNYANNFTKDKCDNIKFKNLEEALKEKQNAYNNSLKALSKWDKYSCEDNKQICTFEYNQQNDYYVESCENYTFRSIWSSCGVPENLYSEYLVDYNRHSKNIDEYNDVINKIKMYLNDSKLRIYSQE